MLLSCFIRLYWFMSCTTLGFRDLTPYVTVIKWCVGMDNRFSCWQVRLLALSPLVGVLVWAPLWFWRPDWEAWLIGKDEGRRLTLVVSNQMAQTAHLAACGPWVQRWVKWLVGGQEGNWHWDFLAVVQVWIPWSPESESGGFVVSFYNLFPTDTIS